MKDNKQLSLFDDEDIAEESKTLDLSETDKAYLAGLIDGEGCISICCSHIPRISPTPRHHLILAIASCDKDVLKYWRDKINFGVIKCKKAKGTNWRDGYTWWLTSKQAAKLLKEVYSYLMIKREQADIAFAFRETKLKKGGSGGRGARLDPEIVHQRERYKQALSRMKGYKTKRGRPKGNGKENEIQNHSETDDPP